MDLQYQTSEGSWVDCRTGDIHSDYGLIKKTGPWEDRTEEFLALCMKNNGIGTREEIISVLESGKSVRNDPEDWYSNCRLKPAPRVVKPVELVKCSCGHSVPQGLVMSASMGTSCADCYDRMS